MNEKPILFCGEMVRAILTGRKSQTRRIVKFPEWFHDEYSRYDSREIYSELSCPHGYPGDLLWVRETFWLQKNGNQSYAITDQHPFEVKYSNGQHGGFEHLDWFKKDKGYKKKPSIFMPRWASRINLVVTDVRVERVQNLSEKDARLEGCKSADSLTGRECLDPDMGSYRLHYRWLWDSINGKRPGCCWSDNPFVWVIEFQRVVLCYPR